MVKQEKQQESQDKNCPICMARPSKAQIDCKHKFCLRCIKRWCSMNKRTCPLCRHNITLVKSSRKKYQYPAIQRSIPIQTNDMINRRVYMFMYPIYPGYIFNYQWNTYPIIMSMQYPNAQ